MKGFTVLHEAGALLALTSFTSKKCELLLGNMIPGMLLSTVSDL
jgi:hypothetical protein